MFGDIFDSKGVHDPFKHLALMVALIGPPPGEFVRRSETTEQCFDRSGTYPVSQDFLDPSGALSDVYAGAWIAFEDAGIPLVSWRAWRNGSSGKKKGLLSCL